jgi:hypothetical protein
LIMEGAQDEMWTTNDVQEEMLKKEGTQEEM